MLVSMKTDIGALQGGPFNYPSRDQVAGNYLAEVPPN